MKIKAFSKESAIDYPKKLSVVVFSPGCNFKCPACYSKDTVYGNEGVDEREFFDYIDSRKGWVDGVVLCGGEPTLQLDLANFARKIKEKGFAVKLDTNGSNYGTLQNLLEKKIIDYVAMDVKGPPYLYEKIVGKVIDIRDNVEKGMSIVTQFPDYEFRTTVVPINRTNNGKEGISFMSIEEAVDMAQWIVKLTGCDKHKHYLQPFVPRKGELIDSRFEEFSETPVELLDGMQKEISKYLPNCRVR